jgi:hypothetical protein
MTKDHITIGCTGSWQKAATPGEPHVEAGRLSRALIWMLYGKQEGATPHFRLPRCPAGAGLIRSAAHSVRRSYQKKRRG